jgi:copper chaperone CopZ
LLQVKGVISADVDWESGLAFVDYISTQTTSDHLVNAVAQAGDNERHHYVAHILE